MSRVGKKPIELPDGVNARLDGRTFVAEGPKGKNEVSLHPLMRVTVADKRVLVESAAEEAGRQASSLHGMTRALLANAVKGAKGGFSRELELQGVGYRASVAGNTLELLLGYSHPVKYPIPQGIAINVEKQVRIRVEGADRRLVGQVAAEIRQFKTPEPYKGKGVRYVGEVVRRKAGKAAAGATSA